MGFLGAPLTGPSFGNSAQAFYVVSDPMRYYGTGPTIEHFPYAFHLTNFGQGFGSQFTGSHMASSLGHGASAPPWYFDSGATSHVTHDAAHISMPHAVAPSASVTMVNGQNIPVAHSGKGILSTPSCTFGLSNLLHVPLISHNLLFVYQFVNDNNCSIMFDSSGYVIQDKTTHQVLHQGT